MKESLYFYLRAVAFALIMTAIIVFCAPVAQASSDNLGQTIHSLQLAQSQGATTVNVVVVAARRGHTVLRDRKIFHIVQSRDDKTEVGILVIDIPDADLKPAPIGDVIAVLQAAKKAGGLHVVVLLAAPDQHGELQSYGTHDVFSVGKTPDGNAAIVTLEGVRI